MVQLVAISVTSPFSFDFNTSYVMVQRKINLNGKDWLRIFQYILCYGSTAFGAIQGFTSLLFQYILCYGSTIAGM